MTEYFQLYQDLISENDVWLQYEKSSGEKNLNDTLIDLFFSKHYYQDTQPNIHPQKTIDMYVNGVNNYEFEQSDIDLIYNFFGCEDYPLGRKWYAVCMQFKNRNTNILINIINSVKLEYGI